MSDYDPYELRAKYTRFRILVIGRANAGKTTLLQRVHQENMKLLKFYLILLNPLN